LRGLFPAKGAHFVKSFLGIAPIADGMEYAGYTLPAIAPATKGTK
jgi:hypothetical protein